MLQDLLPAGSILHGALEDIGVGGLPSFQNPTGWTNLIVSAVLNDILPAIETEAGQAASSIANAVTTFFNVFGNAAPILGPLFGWFVGQVFDSIFDQDPQAWTNVGFYPEKGRFIVLDT